jgi:hypothetical protein
MAKDARSGRSQAEERFDRARRTTEEARAIIDVERDAMRKKTARLRKLRLAHEAEVKAASAENPPAKSAAKRPRKASAGKTAKKAAK